MMKKVNILNVLILLIVSTSVLKAQNTTQKYSIMPVPQNFKNFQKLEQFKKDFEVLKKDAFDLRKLLPSNYKTDGSVDYTKYIQDGLNKYSKVLFPNFPIQINDSGLHPRSNTVLLFPEKSELILKPSKKDRYELIKLHDVNNVSIYFPKIDGNRNRHLGQDGEWGYGISIYSSKRIRIYNPVVENCWGDGICISQLERSQPSEDVEIYYPIINNNRRNGITIASARNLTIERPIISNTFGISPMAAIDIEPASQYYILENITLESPLTYHSRYGIILALTQLSGKHAQPVSITINNHLDIYSAIGFRVAKFREIYKQNPPIKGEIHINNPRWEKSNMQGIQLEQTFNLAPHIYFSGKNAQVQNALKALKANRIFYKEK